jgi:hypothetical protein
MPGAGRPHEQLHRHRVEHFIADDHPGHRVGQLAHPMHLAAPARQGVALPLAQAARQVDDGVAPHPLAQRPQQLGRQRAGTRAEFPDLVGAGGRQRIGDLRGQGLAEQRGHLRRRHEIAAGRGHLPELARRVGVIT